MFNDTTGITVIRSLLRIFTLHLAVTSPPTTNPMMKETLSELFLRDLDKAKEEITLYTEESKLWVLKGGISNSAGNLCLHLIGNLNHFIGATLGQTGYLRERDKEFSMKNIPREDLVNSLQETRQIVQRTLAKLSDADLENNFPLEKHGQLVSTGHMLLHLYAHLNYHLGQINYHRRLVS